jgi:hypothetical protein
MAGCCECGDEPSGSCATELVSYCEVYINCKSEHFSNVYKGIRERTNQTWDTVYRAVALTGLLHGSEIWATTTRDRCPQATHRRFG